jgi:hypothetical protein
MARMETNTTTIGTRNILAVYDLATAGERVEGMEWYNRANRVAATIASEHGISLETAAGVIAALSPNNRWERNIVDAENVIRAFSIGGAEEAENVKVCTYGKMRTKAIQILEATSIVDHASILNGRKITAFYECIIGREDSCCIDGHAYSIWFGDRLTMKQVPNIGKKLYAEIVSDYVEAAEILRETGSRFGHLTAYEVQAVTWVTWRRLHGITK